MRGTIFTIFLFLAIAFIGWSLWTYWQATPKDQSKAKRALAAMWAGLMALAAWVMSLFATPPAG